MAVVELEQGQGQADFVVVAALTLEHPVSLRQNRSHELLGRSLAHTTGDAYRSHVELPSPPPRHLLQRGQAAINEQTNRKR
jgi:hypothetical protein